MMVDIAYQGPLDMAFPAGFRGHGLANPDLIPRTIRGDRRSNPC
jgi:hypothetical protein